MDKYVDFFTENKIQLNLDNIKDETSKKLIRQIPGPMRDTDLIQVLKTIYYNFVRGRKHILFTQYQNKYGTQEMSSNILLPYINGEGVEKSRVHAYLWLSLASQHGIGTALEAIETFPHAIRGRRNVQQRRSHEEIPLHVYR